MRTRSHLLQNTSQTLKTFRWESRHTTDSSKCKLCPQKFSRTTQIMGTPSVDCFASHRSHQFLRYISWKLDPCCIAVDALKQKWTHMFPYVFFPFSLIREVIKKIQKDRVTMILITPTWQSEPFVTLALENEHKKIDFTSKQKNPSPFTHLTNWRV